MNIRELVRRLEKIENMEAEKAFRNEVRKYIDKTIEEKVVEQAMYSGSIAQA